MATERCQGGNLRRITPWLPPVLWLLLIFILSSLSLPVGRLKAFRHQDKLVHFIEYGVLGLLLVRGAWLGLARRRRNYWLCILVAVLYGMSDEFHQLFVPRRTADVWDLVADSLGAFAFAWAWLALKGQRLFGRPRRELERRPVADPE